MNDENKGAHELEMTRFRYDPERLSHEPHLIPYRGTVPTVHRSVFLADGSRIIGDVLLDEMVSVWYNAVIRGDVHSVRIGRGTNIQDNCVIHVSHDADPATVGADVTIGHGAIVHSCTVEDCCLIGMGSTVLDRAIVRSESMVAAGALVPPGFEVPSGVLVGGVPAKVMRELTAEERASIAGSAAHYREYAGESMKALRGGGSNRRASGGDLLA